jgi:hypothetical protein
MASNSVLDESNFPTKGSGIFSQLKIMVKDWRRITHSESAGIAYVSGGPLYDLRLSGTPRFAGPFRAIEDFDKFLRGGLEAHPQYVTEIS